MTAIAPRAARPVGIRHRGGRAATPMSCLGMALSLLLAGCNAPETDDPATARPAPASPVARPRAEGPPTAGVPAAASDEVIVTTNEPFWQARIDAQSVVLAGVGAPERRLAIDDSERHGSARRVRAHDALGAVEVRVIATACTDGMSGAALPWIATLTIGDDGPYRGCARPASMPAPRPADEAGSGPAIPDRFHGLWAPHADACREPGGSIEGITITARALQFHESHGVPTRVDVIDAGTVRLDSAYSGEGQRWTSQQTLYLSGDDTLRVSGPGATSLLRVRCARR